MDLIRKVAARAAAKLSKSEPDFYGVFEAFAQIEDENPWMREPWIKGNIAKLAALPEGHFSTRRDGAIPDQSHILLPALIINLMSRQKNDVNVLDIGGGTGFSYFPIKDYLNDPELVRWLVFDPNPSLYWVGRGYKDDRARRNIVDNIDFIDALPENNQVDIVHAAGTIEYVDDADGMVRSLVERYQPECFTLTRVKGGSIEEYVTRQVVGGFSTPCRFSNVPRLIGLFQELGYRPMIHAPCGGFVPEQFKDIPVARQIRRSVDLILMRDDSPRH